MSGEYWVCEKCGTKNSIEDTYCKKCGRKITRRELADALNRIEYGKSYTPKASSNNRANTRVRETPRQSSKKHQIFDDDSTFVVPRNAVKPRETLQRKRPAPTTSKTTQANKVPPNTTGAREKLRRENLERQREAQREAQRQLAQKETQNNDNVQEKKGIFVPETHKQSKIVKYVPRCIYAISVLVMGICFIVYVVSGTKLGTRVTFWEFLTTLGGNFSKLFQVIYGNIIKMFGGL